jgi:hypothetical protein
VTSSTLSDIEHVRRRAPMYLGDTGFFGLLHYLVCSINSLVSRNPSHVSLTHASGRFRVEADVDLAIGQNDTGDVSPFERFRKGDSSRGWEPVITALSDSLVVNATSSGKRWEISI